MNRFDNKVALVTGGRSGIGCAIAERMRAEGATVITAQRQHDDKFDSIIADFTDPPAPKQVIDDVIQRAGSLHVLINNAGMMTEATVEECELQQWE